jgi:hypothetical protein
MNNGLIIDKDGTKYWYLKGDLHRVDGPAVENSNGDKCWYINGKLHRVEGPALERVNGNKAWYLNGQRHRVDGPAIEWSDGTKAWYINDKLVYSYNINFLHEYPNLTEPFKKSIIKYELSN